MAVFLASIATLLSALQLPAVANGQCSGSTPNYVNFTLKFDWWPEEVNWTLTDDDGNIGLIGGGSYNDYLEVVNQDTCVSDGCYDLLITDDFGDGLFYYGWFTLSLNGYDITFGRQDVDDYFAALSFCTDAFLSGSFNDSIEDSIAITMEAYDYSSEIYVYSADVSNYTKLYYNQYEFPEHWWNASSVTDTIYLSQDFDGCIKLEMINGYADSYNGYLELSYSLDGGLTSEMSYQRDWNDESDIEIIICTDNSTVAPTPPPTFGPSDAVFNVGDDGRFKFTRYVGCEDSYSYYYSDCEASQLIEVNGLCENPRLTMRVYESDYDSNFEQAFIYLNDHYIGNCEPLNDACSSKFRKCNRTDELELDLQGYFNVSDETNKIEVGLECQNVDYCGLYFYNDTDLDEYPGLELDDSSYYWWSHQFNCVGKVEITCDVWDNYTTSMPTSAPTPARDIDTKYNFTLTVQLGSDEETVIWWLYDTFLDSKIYQDVGSNYKDDEQITETFEIGYGCYYLVFNQSDTDSGTQDSFSWYRVELNGQTITHDVHGLDINGSYYWYYGYTGLFWFCTNMYDFSQEPEYTLTLNTYKFDGLIEFYDYLNWNTAWFSIVSNTGADNLDEIVSTKWNVNFGCYVALFYSKINYWEGVGFWYELLANENNITLISRYESEDDDWSYVYFCTNVTQDEDYVGDTYSDVDCSDSEDGDIGFGFSIKFDSWPEEVDWTLKLSSDDDDDGEVAMSGSGDYDDDYEEEFHATCIESGCYDFQITDSWGDGMYHQWGDYGWFRVYVDNSEITFGKQGVTDYDQSMYFCTRLFVSDNDDDPMHSLVIRSIANDTKYKISDCEDTIVYRNEMVTPGFLYYYEDEFDGSVAELTVVEGCYYISAHDNFTVSANGDGLHVAIDEVDSNGAVTSYQAFICLGDATCGDTGASDSSSESSSDSGSVNIANTDSTGSTDSTDSTDSGSGTGSSSGTTSGGGGAVIATVVVIVVLIVIGVLVVVKIRNNKQKAQVDRTASVDMLPNGQEEDINPYVGVVATGTNGETAGRWDMQEIGDGDLPNNDDADADADADGDGNAGDTQDAGDDGDDGHVGDGDFAETR